MLNEIKDIVGSQNVIDGQTLLDNYTRDQSLNPPGLPCAAVKPKNTAEVQELVRFANKTLTPLIPSSSGIHFTGSTLASQGGVIVDLSGMNKILEIDTKNRKVKIEPGVTWHQLQDALIKHDQIPLNPLFPHSRTSALTSSLERAPMLIPKYEYGDPVLTMQVVLPGGDIFKTGTASDDHTDGAYPEGPGIDFFRFFQGAQGTMGIVTWLNIKTEFRPEHQKTFFTPFNTTGDAAKAIYKIQRKHVGNECFLLNNFMLASLICEDYPDSFEKLIDELPPYTLILVIAGAPRRPLERIEYEEKALMEIASDLNFNPSRTVAGLSGLETIITGKLRNLPVQKPYWKNRYKNSTQDIFFITTMDCVQKHTDMALAYSASCGLNIKRLGVYMQPLERGRACHLCFSLPCDLENSKEKEAVRNIFLSLSDKLIREGAFFTRPYGPWADMVYRHSTGYTTALKKLKQVFDPNNILNPGRLCH